MVGTTGDSEDFNIIDIHAVIDDFFTNRKSALEFKKKKFKHKYTDYELALLASKKENLFRKILPKSYTSLYDSLFSSQKIVFSKELFNERLEKFKTILVNSNYKIAQQKVKIYFYFIFI